MSKSNVPSLLLPATVVGNGKKKNKKRKGKIIVFNLDYQFLPDVRSLQTVSKNQLEELL